MFGNKNLQRQIDDLYQMVRDQNDRYYKLAFKHERLLSHLGLIEEEVHETKLVPDENKLQPGKS